MKLRILLISLFFSLTVSGQKYIADYTVAKQEVLRQIPVEYIYLAKKNLRVAYQHTSHGTHVSYGIYGLMDFKTGDDTLFAVSNSAEENKLEYHDFALSSYAANGDDAADLSRNETAFIQATRNYLDDPDNAEINVIMWSWCNIAGHDVSGNYLPGMDSLISEYSIGGSKIGTGDGQRENPVTFIYMTGHGNANNNLGDGKPKNQADLINSACNSNQQFCLDYFSIDAHEMDDDYWDDAGDNGQSAAYGGNFYHDYQDTSILGIHYYENKISIGGTVTPGAHNDQHITANRKAYAMWWILARIAGWDGILVSGQDTVAPSVPVNLQTTSIGNTKVSLSWDASTDNTAVAYYEIYSADVKIGDTTSITFQDTGLNPGTTYIYSVVAVDIYDNRSNPSSLLSVTTTDETVDTEAPSVPSGLVAEAVSTSQVFLSWEPSTDNDGVKTYKLFRADVEIAQTADTSCEDTGLDAGTTYDYKVLAVDNSDNESAPCSPVSVTTLNISTNTKFQMEDIRSGIACFPRPSRGVINIRFTLDKTENLEIVILNILGKVVRRQYIDNPVIGEHVVEFEISDQPRGIYIYQVRTPKSVFAGKVQLVD